MSAAVPSHDASGRRRALRLTAVVLAAVGQLVVGFFTMTAIGLIGMPVAAAVVLALAWAVGALGVAVLARRAPLLTPIVPVAGALVLWLLLAVGGAWLGWTA